MTTLFTLKRYFTLLVIILFLWTIVGVPIISHAQETNEGDPIEEDACCEDLVTCEEILLESDNYCADLEEQIIELQTELEAARTDPPDIPTNGLLHSFAFYRNLPPWAKVLISGTLTVGILAGTMYLEKQTEVIP